MCPCQRGATAQILETSKRNEWAHVAPELGAGGSEPQATLDPEEQVRGGRGE